MLSAKIGERRKQAKLRFICTVLILFCLHIHLKKHICMFPILIDSLYNFAFVIGFMLVLCFVFEM